MRLELIVIETSFIIDHAKVDWTWVASLFTRIDHGLMSSSNREASTVPIFAARWWWQATRLLLTSLNSTFCQLFKQSHRSPEDILLAAAHTPGISVCHIVSSQKVTLATLGWYLIMRSIQCLQGREFPNLNSDARLSPSPLLTSWPSALLLLSCWRWSFGTINVGRNTTKWALRTLWLCRRRYLKASISACSDCDWQGCLDPPLHLAPGEGEDMPMYTTLFPTSKAQNMRLLLLFFALRHGRNQRSQTTLHGSWRRGRCYSPIHRWGQYLLVIYATITVCSMLSLCHCCVLHVCGLI